MTAFYNEIDPYAAQWLRNLIAAGRIAPGVVDERSIEDISPDELSEFTQCHFFAGVGVWSLALRRAGWPDDRPVWTGSCPCQPFSSAGQRAGFTDARHLWPSFAWLIANAKPTVVFGEQVASKAVGPWVDLVHADLETLGYAFGAIPFPSAGVGAPHIRDRLYWVGRMADPQGNGYERARELSESAGRDGLAHLCAADGLGNSNRDRLYRTQGIAAEPGSYGANGGLPVGGGGDSPARLADSSSSGWREEPQNPGRCDIRNQPEGWATGSEHGSGDMSAGAVNGFWRGADWLGCRDDRFRPVEPGTFPLVARPAAGVGSVQPGLSRLYGRNKTGRLKAYGNAINAEAAHEFIAAYLDGLTHSS